MRKAQMNSML